MTAPKLKTTGVAPLRVSLLEAQGYKCAICNLACSEDQAVLDHDHTLGHVRAVLHRGCNAAEGKILKTLKRYGIKDPKAYLEGMVKYHQTHAENQTGFIHPSHFTAEEKLERAKAKVQRTRAKAKATKQKT